MSLVHLVPLVPMGWSHALFSMPHSFRWLLFAFVFDYIIFLLSSLLYFLLLKYFNISGCFWFVVSDLLWYWETFWQIGSHDPNKASWWCAWMIHNFVSDDIYPSVNPYSSLRCSFSNNSSKHFWAKMQCCANCVVSSGIRPAILIVFSYILRNNI